MATTSRQIGERTPLRVLIGEDQPHVSEALRLLLKGEGYQIEQADSPEGVLNAVAARPFDVVLVDLNYSRDTTSGREGLELVERLMAVDRTLPVVVMTAWGSIDIAVEAMHRGARDFIQKPWGNNRVLEVVSTQIREGQVLRNTYQQASQESSEARRIQQGLLPHEIPHVPGYEIATAWQPARIVGGDYFDVIVLGEHRVGLCIADVTGKGLPAALLMSNLQAAVKATASVETSPAHLCAKIDSLIRPNLPDDRFITFFYGVLDTELHTLTYTNAGHNPPLLLRRDGAAYQLETGGPVLGILQPCAYAQGRLRLEPGDRLLLYTDGLTEITNGHGEMFGAQRLVRLLRESSGRGAEESKTTILKAVAEFGEGEFEDDATMMLVKRRQAGTS